MSSNGRIVPGYGYVPSQAERDRAARRRTERNVPGCTCASGARGESCTLDCKAPAWRK